MNYYITYGTVRGMCMSSLRKDVWAEAITYLEDTLDCDGFIVLCYGC